jgi:predicted phosphohydrolase
MKKIQLYSDLHLELYSKFPLIRPLANNLFLAGDIGHYNKQNFKNFFDYCSPKWKNIFYVLGNHEYYINKESIEETTNKYKQFFSNYNNIHLLNNSFVTIDNINIYGSTLWTKPTTDFEIIKKYFNNNSKLDYFDVIKNSDLQYNSLLNYIKNNDKKTIIMSHFPPIQENTSSPMYSNQEKYIKDYFAWNNILLDNKNITTWLSGHTHYSYDFNHNNTRLISNQMGYKNEFSKINFNIDGFYEINF